MKGLRIAAVILAALLLAGWLGRDWLGISDVPADTLRAQYSEGARYVEVLGAQVRVKESGQGEPLLLIHGFAASADTWDGWARELGAHYRLIAVDVPPFGVTGPLPGVDMSPAEFQRFMDALVAALGLEQFHLAGNSMGGLIAWQYAARHPAKVKKLVLVDSAGFVKDAPLPVKLMQTPGIRELSWHFSPKPFIALNVKDVYGDASRIQPGVIQRYHDLNRREGSRPAVSALLPSLQDIDTSSLGSIQTPTLILWGRQDRWIPPAHAEIFHQTIPGSQLIWYEDMGHIPMEEDPARTAADVLVFLQS